MNPAHLIAKNPALAKRCVVWAFAIITILGVFIPFVPEMPSPGMDPSWPYGLNEAVARHFTFGKDIVFTYGPYSSVATRFYDPATDNLMLLGGFVLGLSYACLLLYLAKEVKPWHLVAFLLYVASFLIYSDALIFSYPLLVVACVASFLERSALAGNNKVSPPWLVATGFAIAPLGLLPLIKGNDFTLCGITILFIFVQFLWRRQVSLAVTVLVCPIIAAILFWKISGQAVAALPQFFKSMPPMVAGYTEAMAIRSKYKMEPVVFLVPAAFLLLAIAMTSKLSSFVKVFFGFYMVLFLFVAFKSGFVRHDGHAVVAGCSLLMAAMIACMLFVDTRLIIALALSFLAWFYVDKNHARTSTNVVFDRLQNVYFGFWHRWPTTHSRRHLLSRGFNRGLKEIMDDLPIPNLQGTVDLYPAEQGAVLASNNTWDPRPVFQSYAAYSPLLAGLNEQHLRGETAPDNVLFSVHPIDGRLPAIEDGPSWPALLDNYALTNFDREHDLAYLRKDSSIRGASSFSAVDDSVHETKQYVTIPRMDSPIFAEIDLQPTLAGKLLAVAYRYPRLMISIKLQNGRIAKYRVVANMMRSGFFLSPLVRSTKDFTLLMTGDPVFLRRNAVDSIMISPVSGNGTLWNRTYRLKLEVYQGKGAAH